MGKLIILNTMLNYRNPELYKTCVPNQFTHDITDVREVAHEELTKEIGRMLQENGMGLPKYNILLKSCRGKELAPYDIKWVHHRAGALLRKMNIHPDKGMR